VQQVGIPSAAARPITVPDSWTARPWRAPTWSIPASTARKDRLAAGSREYGQ